MLRLLFAPAGSGKSTLSKNGKGFDGDQIIAQSCGWPHPDQIVVKKTGGKWWREPKVAPLIHLAHAGAIGAWLQGPNRPYPVADGSDLQYIQAQEHPVLFNTDAELFMTHPLISSLVPKGEVGVWLPGLDHADPDPQKVIKLCHERVQQREASDPARTKIDIGDLESNVNQLLLLAKKLKLPVAVGLEEPETDAKPLESKKEDPTPPKADEELTRSRGLELPKPITQEEAKNAGEKWAGHVESFFRR